MRNKWTYIKEYKMRQIILAGIIIGNLLIFILGAVILVFLPENAGKTLPEVIRYSLKLMVDSGGFMDNVTNAASIILTVIIVLAGMICFTGGIVAYMSNMVTNLVDNAESGSNKLRLKKHIIILNWNSKVPLLVADYLRDAGQRYVVVLTDRNKEEVLSEINECIDRLSAEDKEDFTFFQKKPRVIVRKIGRLSRKLFEDVCLSDAESLIIVSPEKEHDKEACDAYVIKQFMMAIAYLSDFLSENDYYNDITNGILDIIVELQKRENEKNIIDYPLPLDDEVESINVAAVISNEVLGKIIASTVLNPDLHKFIEEILNFKGSEIYSFPFENDENTEGAIDNNIYIDFAVELMDKSNAIPMFDIKKNSDTYRIYLSEDRDEAAYAESSDPNAFMKEEESGVWVLNKKLPGDSLQVPDVIMDKKILIIGFNDKFKYVIEEMTKYRSNGLALSVAYTNEAEKNNMKQYLSEDIDLINLVEITNDDIVMEAMNGKTDILILSSEGDNVISDRIPLLIWNLVQRKQILDKHFYIEVLEPQNSEVIKVKDIGGSLFMSNKYVSGLCSQLGTDGNLYDAFMEMFTLKSSKNIWTYKASDLYKTDDKMNFVSKKEAIVWTYSATNEKIVLLGLIRDGVSYLFSNIYSDLNECSLYPGNWDGSNEIKFDTELIIEPTDTLIVLDKGDA